MTTNFSQTWAPARRTYIAGRRVCVNHVVQMDRKGWSRWRVIPPLRCDGQKIDKHTPGIYLRQALAELGLGREGLRWYQATRRTFASVVITERYAHLRPDLFTARDLATIDVSLSGDVVPLSAGERAQDGHR